MSLPSIQPNDLRDHVDPARVERIWSRVASALPEERTQRAAITAEKQSFSRPALFSRAAVGLAVAASFAGGALVHASFFSSPDITSATMATSEHVNGARSQVYAAGSSGRTFELDNGVKLTLGPEGLMELDREGAHGPVFKLLRGKVAVDATDGQVAIRSGEATLRLAGAAATIAILGPETLEATVSRGVVDVDSPDEAVRHLSSADSVQRISTAKKVATREDDSKIDRTDLARRASPSSEPRIEEVAVAPEATSSPVAAPPSWYEIYKTDRASEALRVVEQSGGLDALVGNAQSASELLALEDLARTAGRSEVRIRALTRIADEFPTSSAASVAARTLANLFEKIGEKDKAAFYNARLKGTAFEQDAICDQLRGHMARDPIPAETLSLANGYLVKYPDGTCRDLAQSIVDDAAAAAKAPPVKKDDENKKDVDPKDAGVKTETPDAARQEPPHGETK
jgi:hypothetical protein